MAECRERQVRMMRSYVLILRADAAGHSLECASQTLWARFCLSRSRFGSAGSLLTPVLYRPNQLPLRAQVQSSDALQVPRTANTIRVPDPLLDARKCEARNDGWYMMPLGVPKVQMQLFSPAVAKIGMSCMHSWGLLAPACSCSK